MEMTAKERTRVAMSGGIPDRVPVFPVITDYHASRLAGIPLWRMALEPDLRYQVLYKAWEEYGFDGFELPVGSPKAYRENIALLQEGDARYLLDKSTGERLLRLEENNYPVPLKTPSKPIVEKEEDLDKLPFLSTRQYIQQGYMDSAAHLIERIGQGAFISGNNGGQTMNGLVDLRGPVRALSDLYDQPSLVHAMMDFLTQRTIEIGKAFIEIGVDAIYIGDAWASASIISPALFREYCVPYYQKAAKVFHQYGVLVYLHICGNTVPILDDMAATGVDAIEPLDPLGGVDLQDAKQRVGDKVCLKGGINTLTLLNGTEEDVRNETQACIAKGAIGGGFIFGTGDDIPRDAPFENIHAMVQTVKSDGRYDG